MAGIARTMHLAHGATEGLDFSLIRILLALEQFQHLQNLFHVIERAAQHVNYRVYLFYRFFNGRGRSGLGRLDHCLGRSWFRWSCGDLG